MFPQFTNTAASLTRATALIHRVGTDAYLYDDPEDANIASLLDSKFEAEKVQGLKRLIALLSQGVDVSNFFPHVCLSVCPEFLLVHSFKLFSGSESSLS
jgi:AP-3 complex subunit beta